MRIGWLLGSALVAAVAVVACSSDTTASPYPDVASFCTAVATAECNQVASVCGNSVDACKSARTTHCNALAAGGAAKEIDVFSVTGTGRKYTSANVQSCLDQVNGIYAKKVITPADYKSAQDACNKVFQGTADKNQACLVDADCTGSLLCDKKFCASKVDKSLSDPCGNPGDICDSSSYCAAGTPAICTARAKLNEVCSATKPCTSDLYCSGVCSQKKGSGAPCLVSTDCSDAAPYCDPNNTNKCDAGVSFAVGASSCKDFGG
jgi:hypothetical protein